MTETSSRDQMPPMRPRPTNPVGDGAATGSYLDWPAILAGGVFALALVFLLISFGSTIGLSLTSPYRGEGVSAGWLAIAAAIWFAWVMVTGFGAGGYLAGRMRKRAGDATAPEVEVRDGTHGLLVWATAVVLSSVLAAMGAGGLIGMGAVAVGSATDLATEAAEGADAEYLANVMLRGVDTQDTAETADTAATPAPATDTPTGDIASDEDTAAAPAQAQAQAQATQPEQQATAQPAIAPEVQQQIAMVLLRSITSGEMRDRDRSYLSRVVAANTDLDQEAARTRVDEVTAEIEATRAQAVAAVERARVTGVVFGFIAAATLLLGAIAAFLAATAGGRHRNEGLGFDVFARRS